MKFDDVLVKIGEFGTYQKRIYFLLCLPAINSGIFMVISVFILGVPNHRCAIPGYDNDTYEVQNHYHQMLINKTIPPPTDEKFLYHECHLYVNRSGSYDTNNKPINATEETCSKWVYDKTDFESTFTSEKDLVCGDDNLPSVAKMLFFGGVLVGAFVFGVISDVIGRKKTLLISFVINIGTSIGLAWADSYIVFVVLRFLIGAANAGIFLTGFVIGMELVGPSKRMWAGVVVEYFFAIGLLILAGVAYLLRDWKYIEMAVAFPNILYLSYYWIVPESPRWLLSQGRFVEAEEIMRKAAEVNKASLPDKIFDKDSIDLTAPKGKLWHLFSTRVMFIRTLVIFFNWMVVSMVYYGLSLNTGNLGGNFYLNFTISGLVEFPAYTLCILLLDRIGRKWLHFIAMVAGGVACVSTVFTTIYGGESLHAVTVTLAMIGKLGAAAAFAVIYIFSAELYPTVVRNAGMGASSCCARVGGILAPYVADMNKVVSGDFGRALPLVIFGAASIAAGVLALALPETLHKELPESIVDAEHFGKKAIKEKEKEVYVNEAYDQDINLSDETKSSIKSNGHENTVTETSAQNGYGDTKM
ncbi:organic cation transporter protein-like [Ruditapes philippinarum]|uniref:organic cation transporter protein-like n=1 Tax=Ruditapes philippinarum TaxID=129788 RepID=UPI00295BD126|nr:organic cation transporter protein-like [Ruditapes philippinarum]